MALSLRNAVRSPAINTLGRHHQRPGAGGRGRRPPDRARDADALRLLLAAGNETTNLIGNGMLALLRNPDQLQALRDDPGLIPSAVEELLRFDSPVQTNFRGAAEDYEVNSHPVKRGQTVVLLLGAANRDPAEFAQPDRLDITRHPRSHVAFGRGIHHCLGAPLALLEGRIVIEMLLERFASIRLLTDRPTFRNSVVLRGLESLPIAVTPA